MAPRSDAGMRLARHFALAIVVLVSLSNCGREPTAPGTTAIDAPQAFANDPKGPQSTLATIVAAGGAISGQAFATQPSVQFLNPQGKPQPRGEAVTAALENAPAGALLLGTATITAVSGVATFTNLGVSIAGSFTIVFSAGGAQPVRQTIIVAPPTFTLSVTKTGNGSGTVTSSPAGIDCGIACAATFNAGSLVTLTAAASASSTFEGWSGACTGTGPCVVTMDAAKSVTATFTLRRHTLTVTRDGAGPGTVTSSPAGIDCGADCSEEFDHGTVVTLSAAPGPHGIFRAWGGDCPRVGDCVIVMDGAKNAIATFDLTSYFLSVTKAGTGGGTVASDVAGISCGSLCAQAYSALSVITLTASPDASSEFTGWSGGTCSGTGPCVVTMDDAKNVTATFTRTKFPVTVVKNGTGAGFVQSQQPGINCGPTCTALFNIGMQVTLVVLTDPSSTFTGWSGGGCSGNSQQCIVTVDAAKTVTATFTLNNLQRLTVNVNGPFGNSVTSAPSGINCTPDCSEDFTTGTPVVLTAIPDFRSVFTGWSGGGCGTDLTCAVTMNSPTGITANFALKSFTLSVSRAGLGTGTVTSSPAGIQCGTDCSESFNIGSQVTLTATPDVGSIFAGWTGGGCSGSGTCVVSLNAATSVTANFSNSVNLTVTKSGSGAGTVTSSPAGIDCGLTCATSFTPGTEVTLTATPSTGSTFTGWSGGSCTGTGSCVVTMNAAKFVTANFGVAMVSVTVTKTGTGTGSVTPSPMGTICGANCLSYPQGATVTFTQTPDPTSTFAGWSGACTGTAQTCVLTLTEPQTVIAAFTAQAYNLNVLKTGTGPGTVTSSPAGINCGSSCFVAFQAGTVVTLSAAPGANSVFTGWSGSGCTGNGSCVVTMDAAKSVTATFTATAFQLSVNKVGGLGTVTTTPAGISCGPTCQAFFAAGTPVTLFAAPDPGYVFRGWSGVNCIVGGPPCIVTMNQTTTVIAQFDLAPVSLTVTKTGNGTVTSTNGAINCGSSCVANFLFQSTVTLNASPAAGWVFTGWTGACTGTGSCTVTMPPNPVSVGATFTQISYNLTVTKAGAGTGTVTSTSPGINCGTTCTAAFPSGTVVQLVQLPGPDSRFVGWSGGGCSGTGTCLVTMNAATSVTATYNQTGTINVIVVNENGSFLGTVRAPENASEINCPGDCSQTYDVGTVVTLTANSTDSNNSFFRRWDSPPCMGSQSRTCTITVTAGSTSLLAIFTSAKVLSIQPVGSQTAKVTATTGAGICPERCVILNGTAFIPIGLSAVTCTGPCQVAFPTNTGLTLRADEDPQNAFTGWGGDCTGFGSNDCVLTMAFGRTVNPIWTPGRTLTMTVQGNGQVTSSPGGINCGSDCTEVFPQNQAITLTATAFAPYVFDRWASGPCANSTNPICTIGANTGTQSVVAQFSIPVTLAVSMVGQGTVTSSPAGIACTSGTGTCSVNVSPSAVMVLTATPAPGYAFSSWSGCGSVLGNQCTVPMSGFSRTATVTFVTTPSLSQADTAPDLMLDGRSVKSSVRAMARR